MKADAKHMPLLAIEGMRVEFPSRRGHVVAVERLDLTLEPGEILGVVGESGRASRPSAMLSSACWSRRANDRKARCC
jgi:ABC-type dipeptide/oligopeptide/nickel transport system ATPase component